MKARYVVVALVILVHSCGRSEYFIAEIENLVSYLFLPMKAGTIRFIIPIRYFNPWKI